MKLIGSFASAIQYIDVFVDVLNDRLSRNVFDPAHPGTRVYGRGDAYLRWEDQEWMTKPRV